MSSPLQRGFDRRSLLKGLGVVGAAVSVGSLLTLEADAESGGSGISHGDAAILRFLAAAEILETDLWQQYNELAGIQDDEVPGGSGSPDYAAAVSTLDSDMAQYIHDNTEDELTHEVFINAYLVSKGAAPVNLDQFRTLPSSKASGAQQIGRLTNLMQLSVDTTWWTRYRSRTGNPDLGDSFPQAIPTLAVGQHTAIPRTDADLTRSQLPPGNRQHCRLSLCNHRAGRNQPLSQAGAASNRALRSCESCSASAAPKSPTSRPGATRPATRRCP